MSEQPKIIVLGGASPELRAALSAAAGHGIQIVEPDDTAAVMAILGDRIDQDENARKAVRSALDTILKDHAVGRPRLLSEKQRGFLIAASVAAHEQDQKNDEVFIASAVEYGQDALGLVPDTELLFRSLIGARGLNQMDDDDRHRTLLMLATTPGVLHALMSAATPQDLCMLMDDVKDAVEGMPEAARAVASNFALTIAEAVRVAQTVPEPDESEYPAP